MDSGSITRAARMHEGQPLGAGALAVTVPVRAKAPPDGTAPAFLGPAVMFEPSERLAERASLDQALRDLIQRHITIEPKTREVVHQTVNSETGEVLRQFPEEAILRLRAYARELAEASRRSAGETTLAVA